MTIKSLSSVAYIQTNLIKTLWIIKWTVLYWRTDLTNCNPSQNYILSQEVMYQTSSQYLDVSDLITEHPSLQTPYITAFSVSRPHRFARRKPHRGWAARPSAHLPVITAREQHYNNGHLGTAKSEGRAQQWSHTTITGEPNPPSRLFVRVKPRDLARRWLWRFQYAAESKQHTPAQISAMCGVILGSNRNHVYTYITCLHGMRNFMWPKCNSSIRTSQNRRGLERLSTALEEMALMSIPVGQMVHPDKCWTDC